MVHKGHKDRKDPLDPKAIKVIPGIPGRKDPPGLMAQMVPRGHRDHKGLLDLPEPMA